MTRIPPISPPELSIAAIQPHVLHYELVTPMYGGGVKAHTVDEAMPIRASAIRGQLRFWWRLLAKNKWKLGSVNDIRKAEFALWGGMDDKDPKASKVLIKIKTPPKLSVQPWAAYTPNHAGKLALSIEKWADVPYALFPAQGTTEFGKVKDQPHELAQAGLQWAMQVRFTKDKPLDPKKPNFDPNISEIEESQVWEAIRWWSFFGGVGARTRRGLGAVQLLQVSSNAPEILLQPITPDEATTAGCQLLIKGASASAYSAWQTAVNKLRDFRQKPDLGRNVGQRPNRPGRSRWPEPDAVRRLTRQAASQHAPTHQAGNIFPRAAFGLPIIFHFQGGGDPSDTTLNPVIGEKTLDRMASPVILRPIQASKNTKGEMLWAAGVLLLPHDHIACLQLKLSGQPARYYDPAQAVHILPINAQNSTTPLQAFMTYFAK